MYDFHTHLNHPKLFEHREAYLRQFIEYGGRGLINAGASHEYNTNALIIAQQVRLRNIPCQVKASFGFHPYEAVLAHQDTSQPSVDTLIQELQEFVSYQDIVAIGECGIDLHYPNVKHTLHDQQRLFDAQLSLAQEFDLPIVIHSRQGREATMEVLNTQYRRTHSSAIYLHCRGYGTQELETLLQIFPDCFVGFDGNITYESALDLQDSARLCPLDNLVTETDAPYLTPVPYRGKTNKPHYVSYVEEAICKDKAIPSTILEDTIKNNRYRLWRFPENVQ